MRPKDATTQEQEIKGRRQKKKSLQAATGTFKNARTNFGNFVKLFWKRK